MIKNIIKLNNNLDNNLNKEWVEIRQKKKKEWVEIWLLLLDSIYYWHVENIKMIYDLSSFTVWFNIKFHFAKFWNI